jgi:hypothetical protein
MHACTWRAGSQVQADAHFPALEPVMQAQLDCILDCHPECVQALQVMKLLAFSA